MRTSLAILAAAAVGFGGAALGSTPASAVTLTPLVHQGAAANTGVDAMQVRYRGYGYHRGHRWHRDRSGRAVTYGLLGFGAGLALSQLAQPRYHTYGGYPHYRTYGGHPQYRVYGGYPQGQSGTTVDNRAPIHRP